MTTKQPPIWSIRWSDELSVGIAEIDREHQHFFELINRLNRAIRERAEKSEIIQILQLIWRDAEQHFAHEEQFFAQWHYPDVEEHAAIHQRTLDTLQRIRTESIAYDLDSEWITAALKIKEILIEHILLEDNKYAKFLSDAGQQPGQTPDADSGHS